MDKRYTGLRIIGTIYKVLGIIAGVITILVVLSICATSILGGAFLNNLSNQLGGETSGAGLLSGVFGGLVVGLFAIINGGGIAVTLYALGEGIYLFLAMEENTRAITDAAQEVTKPGSKPDPEFKLRKVLTLHLGKVLRIAEI